MIQYYKDKIIVNGKEYSFNGLNVSNIVWHLQESYHPESFFESLHENYSIPEKIHYMSLAEGKDFDALLIDDKMFRVSKLSESDLASIQEYINKYAYATALVKLLECSQVLGSGLSHKYSLSESYSFVSGAYDKLLTNVYKTNEKGRIIESFGSDNKMIICEGNDNYIRDLKSTRIVENWKDTFKHENIKSYNLVEAKQDGDNAVLTFVDNTGALLEAVYKDTSVKVISSGFNVADNLSSNNLVESYRVGTLNEYNQPFTLNYATITGYDYDGNKLMLRVQDAFGNNGTVPVKLNIPVEEFKEKYNKELDNITSSLSFGDGLDATNKFLANSASDIASFERIKGMLRDERTKENQLLSYKVAGFVPVVGDQPTVFKTGKEKFGVSVLKGDKPYQLSYLYTGVDPINEFINMVTSEIDDYNFSQKSDVVSFFQLLDDYGDIIGSYPTGISTKDRNYKRNIKEEAEGVQTTDIAPKVDQDVKLIKVTMKKKKKADEDMFDADDLLINTINEQDEFYGSRGFIKDENGRYHFGDYYINESGKVVHKSKLNEEFIPNYSGLHCPKCGSNEYYEVDDEEYEDGTQAFHHECSKCGYVSGKDEFNHNDLNEEFWNEAGEKEYKGVKISVEKGDKGNTCYIPLRNDKFKPEDGTQFFSYKEVKEYIDNKLSKSKLNEMIYYCDGCGQNIDDDYNVGTEIDGKWYCENCAGEVEERKLHMAHDLAKMYDVSKEIATKYMSFPKDIQNIKKHGNAGHYDKSEWGDLNESQGQEVADEAYYKVNDAALKLQEVKPFIEEGSEQEKLYNELILKLNELQMGLHNTLKESSDIGSGVEETSFKQGDEEFTVHSYNYGDDSFNISYKIHGKRHITNEPFTVDGEYNFIYDEENKEVLTGMKKDGKIVPDNWGKMTNVSKDRWLEMVHNPKDELIPWVQGAHLD